MTIRTLCIAVGTLFFVAPFAIGQEKEQMEMQMEKGHHFAIKELDRFHDVLHPLVHDALPDNDFDTIRKNLDALMQEAEAIVNAALPEKYEAKKREFGVLAEALVNQLAGLKETADDEELAMKFEERHGTFEQMAGMLR